LLGNGGRGVAPHPLETLPEITDLWPGSWINASYDTWIGEKEENRAWEYLARTRRVLTDNRVPPPSYRPPELPPTAFRRHQIRAWESLYAAEGSDWFWWFGVDQTAGEGDRQFEQGFLTLLNSVYAYLDSAGLDVAPPHWEPILEADAGAGQGVMARSTVRVFFTCRATTVVPKALYLVGGLPQLGNWVPNKIPMFDDGTHGDARAGDGIWTREVKLPEGETVLYKYTNSGVPGQWGASDEAPGLNRRLKVRRELVVHDVFGALEPQ